MFHLTAITRRRDALFQTSTIGGWSLGRTDTAQLTALRTEVMIWRALETAVREPVAVYATTSSGGMFNVRVALRQRVPGEARNAIAACFGALANVKNVFVVDPDIDIFSDEQMDWALATRFQPDRDLMVMGGMRTLPLDPSLTGRAYRRQGRLRPDLAVRHRRPARDPRAGAAALCRRALRLGRGRARRRAEVLRGADGGGGQPRRPRDRARARRAARRKASTATAKDAISSNPNSAVTRKRKKREKRMSFVLRRSVLACLAALGAVLAPAADAQEVTVKVGIVRSISTVAILMAIEKGYFKEFGIKVSMDDSTPPPTSIALLAQNQLQMVEGGISAGYFNALEKNLPITMVVDRVSSPLGHNLMLRPDLKGRSRSCGSSRARSSPATARARSRPTRSARCWRPDGLTIADVDIKVFPFTQMASPSTTRRSTRRS